MLVPTSSGKRRDELTSCAPLSAPALRRDQVEVVASPRDPHGLQLLAHVAVGDCVRELKNAVGEHRLPVVDVGDDRELRMRLWSMAGRR